MMRFAFALALVAGSLCGPGIAWAEHACGSRDAVARVDVFLFNDKGGLSRADRQKLARLGESNGTKPLCVVGYAETEGDTAYNRKLALRRAKWLAGELKRAGVPAQALMVDVVVVGDLPESRVDVAPLR